MAIRKDLTVVKMCIESKWYEIRCEKPKVEVKQSVNERKACNSYYPYEVNPSEENVTVELPGVDQSQRNLFRTIMANQRNGKMKNIPNVVIYKYDNNGAVVLDYHLNGFYIESISQEGNEPFDVKGGATTPVQL